jgi:hypothetical protein
MDSYSSRNKCPLRKERLETLPKYIFPKNEICHMIVGDCDLKLRFPPRLVLGGF